MISTDKADYGPGEVVLISGTGFTAGPTTTVTVQRPDGAVEACDSSPRFLDPCPNTSDWAVRYDLDGILGTYYVNAPPASQISFTDFLQIDWRQCENDHNTDGVIDAGGICFWTTGNLDVQHNLLAEGNTLPDVPPSAGNPSGRYTIPANSPGHSNQRAVIKEVPDGTLKMTVRHTFTKGGEKAYDFLTTNYGINNTNLCNQLSGAFAGVPCSTLVAAGPSTMSFPDDTTSVVDGKTGDIQDRQAAHDLAFSTGAGGKTALPASEIRKLKIYGLGAGSITSIVSLGISGSTLGDSDYSVEVTFTKSTGGDSDIIATFGAHFAIGSLPDAGWGTGNGAGSISGSPFHVIFDGLSEVISAGPPKDNQLLVQGNRDNQVSLSAVLSVTVSCPAKGTNGKPITCTATGNGGKAPYTFSWSAPGGSPSSGTGSSFTTTYALAGNYTISVTITDSRGVTSTSSTIVRINQQPKVLTVICPAGGTAGKPVTCTATSSGGTPPIEFFWTAPGGTPGGGTGPTFTTTYAVKGTYTIIVEQFDAGVHTVTETRTVVIAPQPLTVTVDCPDSTAGKPFDCTVSASGGTPPYSGTGSFTVTLPVKGTYPVTFSVTDANGDSATGSDTVVITQQPLIVTVDCDNGTAGKPFECRVSASGGTAPYGGTGTFSRTQPVKGTYTESFLVTDANGKSATGSDSVVITQQPFVATADCPDDGLTAGKPFTCTVSATGGTAPYGGTGVVDVVLPVKGTFPVCFGVTDANGKGTQACDTVVIVQQPLVVTVDCDNGTSGKPFECRVSASGGTAPYTGTGSFTVTIPVKGTYTVTFDVTDANGKLASGSDSVVITQQFLVVITNCPNDGLTAGKPFECTVTATGGTAPYTGTGTFTVTIPVKGSYVVSFDVRDANGKVATGDDFVTIVQQALVVTVDCDNGTAGKPLECRVSASGGTAPYTGTGSFTVTIPVKGTYTVGFDVRDANGKSATGSDSVVITQQPFVASVDCPDSGLTAGKPFECTVSATGGTAPYTGTGTFTVTIPVKGSYTVSFDIRDVNGKLATGSDSVLIVQQPLVVVVDCDDGTSGKPFECRVSATGGTAPYTGTGSFIVTLPVKGTYTVSFDVRDVNGKVSTGSDIVRIFQQPLIVTTDCDDGTAGKPFECRVSAVGGTAPYTGTGVFTVTLPVKGMFPVTFTVYDANGKGSTGTDIVRIVQQPLVVSVDCDDGTAGKPFECRVSATGGTTPYFGTGSHTVTIPVKGTYTVSFTVKDANDKVSTGSDTVLIIQQPLVVTVDCDDGTAGKPFECRVSAAGGTAPYTGTGPQMVSIPTTGTNTATFSVAIPVKGTYTVSFELRDANGKVATGSDVVRIFQQPLIVTTECDDGTAGKPFECRVSAVGGTGPYTGTGVFTVTIPVKGMYPVTFTVYDANGKGSTGTDIVRIVQQPLVVTVDCPNAGLTAGKPFICDVSASGGTAPYTFTTLGGVGPDPGTMSSFTIVQSVKGDYTQTFIVTDANGKVATGSDTTTIIQQPLVVTVRCDDFVTAGKPFTCDVSAVGGTAPYAGTGSFTVAIPVKGDYTVSFDVRDANGKVATGSDFVRVIQQPLVVTVDCDDSTAGKPFECRVFAVGGTAPYFGTGSFMVSIPVKGEYTVSFDVRDSNGKVATGSDRVRIIQQPLVISATCSNGTSGKPIQCDATASGGTAPYTFSWDVFKDGTIDGTGVKFHTTFPVKGPYSIDAIVVDANNKSAFVNLPVIIAPQPLMVVRSSCDSFGTAGKPITCIGEATGGTSPYTFFWDIGKDGTIDGSGATFVTSFPVKGTYSIDEIVVDVNNDTAIANFVVVIGQQPLIVTVRCDDFVTAGKPFLCEVSAVGGTAPYTGTGSFTVTIPVKGDYTVSFDVRDANGKLASGSDGVRVIQQPLVVTADCDDFVTAGKPFECRVSAVGGTAPYTGTGSFTVTIPVKGDYTVSFDVRDANGKAATGSDGVRVIQQPLVVTVRCDDFVTAGKPFTCEVSAVGGTAPYTGTGSFTVTIPVKGDYTVSFDVRDANGKIATGSDGVRVIQQPLVVTVGCDDFVTSGKPFTCDVSAVGGTAPYTGTGSFTVTIPVKGDYTVTFDVRDANGKLATGFDFVRVIQQPLVVTVGCDDFVTAGKPFLCEVSAVGGTSPYTGTGTFTVTIPVKGDYTVSFDVRDANGKLATGSDGVRVIQQPLVVTVDCDDFVTAGKPFECRVSAVGGTAPYVGTGSFTVTIPVKGDYTVSFDVRDANGKTANGSDSVRVIQQPLVATVSCDDLVTAGKPFNCEVSAVGGTAPYVGTGSFTVAIPVKGDYTVSFDVRDVNGKIATSSDLVTVIQQPLIVTVDCDGLVTAGKPFECRVSAIGGTAPYVGTGSFTVTIPVKGEYTVSFDVRDANGKVATDSDVVFVAQQPLIVTVDCDDFVTAGKPFECRVSATGGTAPYVGTGSFTVTIPVKGTYTVSFDVRDSNGKVATGSDSVLVRQQPLVVTVDCSDGTSGKPFFCGVSATGGTAPYVGTGNFTVTIPTKGTYTVSFDVRDANGKVSTGSDTVLIRQQPLVITAQCSAGTAGKPTDCNATASGGTAPYAFLWDVGKDGTIDGYGSSFTTVFPVKGSYSIDAIVTDANQKSVFVNLSILVRPQPVTVTAQCDTKVTAGKPFSCTGSGSGGTAPYVFYWDVDKDGTIEGTGPSFVGMFSVKGLRTVDVTLVDSNNDSATFNFPILVNPQPLLADFTSVCIGSLGAVQFDATVSGGTSPYQITWSFGDSTTGKGASVTHVYSPAGVFTVTMTVTDANGVSTTVKKTIVACGIGFTDTSFCFFDKDPSRTGQQFRLIFVQDPQNMSTYKLIASNPGQFYDNVFYTGTVGSKATLMINIPFPFVTQGAVPIQVHDSVTLNSSGCFVPGPNINSQFTITSAGGSLSSSGNPIVVLGDYAPQTFGSTTTVTVQGFVPASGLIYVTIHLDYGLKGQVGYQKGEAGNAADTLDAIDTTLPVATVLNFQSYTFSVKGSLTSSTTVESENVFKRDPGFAGVVTNSVGTPLQGVRVEIWRPTGTLLAVVYTDENGFYQYQYKHSGKPTMFTVRLPAYGVQQTVELKSNKVVLVNFQLMSI